MISWYATFYANKGQGASREVDMLGRTVASSKKNSLAGRFSKRLIVTWGSFCALTRRTGKRRAARKLALISIRAPRWAKQRRG